MIFILSFCFFGKTYSQNTVPIRVVSYNLLNFPNGRDDCGTTNVNLPNRTDTLRKIMRYLQPDIFVGCEIQSQAGCDSILSRTLNVFGAHDYARANFVYNTSGGNDLQNMLFYKQSKLVLKEHRIVQTSVRDLNQYILYVIDPTLPLHHDTCFIEVFMCHLKAGNTTADLVDRAAQTTILKQVIASRPANRSIFVCGDMNSYTSSEQAYQNLLTGSRPLYDPLGMPGSWTSNPTFSAIHTQSPRLTGYYACGSTGGMDDRFDHILVTQNVLSGSDSVKYVTNSYKAVGNDGNHYNTSLLALPHNTMYPDSVVNALFYMSDHLPVKLDVLVHHPLNYGLNLTYSINANTCSPLGLSATVVPLIGTAPFSYNWGVLSGNQQNQTAINLLAGVYDVTVTDAQGIVDHVFIEIPAVSTMSASVFSTPETTNCDGSSFVVVAGGSQPYSFQWDDSQQQTSYSLTGLCAGNYTCVVTDATGCQLTLTTTILPWDAGLEEQLFYSLIHVSPNPFESTLTIEIPNELINKDVTFQLYSVIGDEVLFEKNVKTCNNQVQIEGLQFLKHGTYFLKIESGTTKRYFQLLK
jgi:hypothetical protein